MTDENRDDAGRGMLVDEETSEDEREKLAEEMEAEIQEHRQTEWHPE